MCPTAFTGLCEILVKDGGLRPTLRITIEEQVVKSLYLLAHSVTNQLEDKFIKQPDGSQVPLEILNNNRFYPFFKDCVGAIDGTHIRVKVSPSEAPKYRGRKDYPTQNVLAACTFDLKFTYVLPGWEGKYYLVDAGFMLRSGLITPYRGERYHLKEYSRNPPRNARELFNLRHASLRNAIERAFGVVKKRFPIIANPDENILAEVDAELTNNDIYQDQHRSSREESEDELRGELLRESIATTMMSKRKQPLNNEGKSVGGNTQCFWSKQMDDILIDAYVHQHQQGFRVNGTFTVTTLENIAKEMKQKFPDQPIDKEKVKNRMKHIKRCWFPAYDIFKNGMSGFAWDPISEMFIAEPKVWEQLIKVKPEVAAWMNKPIRNYEKLYLLYGNDRATGKHAETAAEMRQRRAREGETNASQVNNIDDVDFLVSENEVTLENFNGPFEEAQI
ncbi:hypothetical protein GH714_014273 [Hevea brasiliensis]|uniref:Myb/SANT-like domain-containing protein n=1 Tax=Hevea brasiliensis TaxID=3981 RepID=A0A6A6N3R9_HEVBR|nr:hypothetical protein GH714_014273 [Hevea brasiliensis]